MGRDNECCENCLFWYPPTKEEQNGFGGCHRYPITVTSKGDLGTPNGQWPRTKAATWCGEWQSVVTDNIVNDVAEWTSLKKPVKEVDAHDLIMGLLKEQP